MSAPETPRRTANILVLVALAAMLVGTVLLLAARDPMQAEVPAGATETVMVIAPADWDPLGRSFELRVFITQPGMANVTVRWDEGSHNKTLTTHDAMLTVGGEAEGGERVALQVQNEGPRDVRVTGETESRITYVAGGAFVLLGLLGFGFYRAGMS